MGFWWVGRDGLVMCVGESQDGILLQYFELGRSGSEMT